MECARTRINRNFLNEGCSYREIARRMGVGRNTIAKYRNGNPMELSMYGCYFLEFADYYGRENADDLEMLKLLYQTVRALCKKTIAYPLIRCIYELKIMAVNGECPQCFECACCHTTENLSVFSARYRGLLCEKCAGHEKMTTISISPAATDYIIKGRIKITCIPWICNIARCCKLMICLFPSVLQSEI